MADGFSYGGFSGPPYPFWLSSPFPHPPSSPVNLTQGGFDPMISRGFYRRSPSDRSTNPSYGGPSLPQTTPSSFYVNNSLPGNLDHRGEDSYTYMLPPRETSSSDYVPLPTDYLLESQRLDRIPYKFSVEKSADMLIRNSQEPFYNPNPPSGVYASSGCAFDEKRSGQYHDGYDKFESVNTVFDGSQTSHAPEEFQSSLLGSSVEPVNFNVLLGYGEATGHVKPLSEKPDLPNERVGSTGSSSPRASHTLQFEKEKREGSGVSSLYQTPKTYIADSENGVSETSLKNAIDDLNCDEHRSWNQFMVSSERPSAPTMFSMGGESCVAMKADNGNAAQSAVNYRNPSDGNANQPSEDVRQAIEKTCKLQKQMFDMTNRDNKTTSLSDMGIKGDSPSLASSPRVSSVVNAMHNLSEVLVYECFNNGSWLKPEQLENLDKVVENLTKCLKKVTGNKTIAGEASIPTQSLHVSCPNVGDLNEASNVFAKDCQGINVKPLDNFGLKEPVDKDKDKNKDEMTQSIKNILASNFPDGEENHPQTLLYKSLWLETEAALCSTTCMTRYHRIKKEIGNIKLQNREIAADASTFMQEPFLNPQEPVSVMNNVEQETTDSFIKHGSNSGNDIVKTSRDAPQSSKFKSDSVDSVLLGLMSRSFMGGLEQEDHQNFKPDAATSGKIPDAFTTEEKHNDFIDRFQILKQQETNRKLKSQNCSKEENPEASEVANTGRNSQMNDVMDRFKILKRREAEKVEESLNSLDTDSDSDCEARNKTQICDHLWSDSMLTIGGSCLIETYAANTEEPSASGEGCESPTSDWEHVRKGN